MPNSTIRRCCFRRRHRKYAPEKRANIQPVFLRRRVYSVFFPCACTVGCVLNPSDRHSARWQDFCVHIAVCVPNRVQLCGPVQRLVWGDGVSSAVPVLQLVCDGPVPVLQRLIDQLHSCVSTAISGDGAPVVHTTPHGYRHTHTRVHHWYLTHTCEYAHIHTPKHELGV